MADEALPAVKLYVIPGSHPAMAVRRMLELKGIPYKRRRPDARDLPCGPEGDAVSLQHGALGGNRRAQAHRLAGDRGGARSAAPRPAPVPSDHDERVTVTDAERWGEEILQPAARRISWNVLKRDRSPLASYAEGARLGVPIGLAVKTAAPIVAAANRMNSADDETVRADLAALPGWLQRIDDWIAEGVLGADPPNAADLQIAASLRLMMSFDDVRPAIEGRPAGEMALRAIPEFPGRAGPILPPAWLEPLRQSEPTRSTR